MLAVGAAGTAATLRSFMVTAVRDGFSGGAAILGVQWAARPAWRRATQLSSARPVHRHRPADKPPWSSPWSSRTRQGAAVAAPIAGADEAALQAKDER
jgi:hypothetical protein